MLEMLMIVFMILFFMAFAQANSAVNSKGNEWKVAAYGIPRPKIGQVGSVIGTHVGPGVVAVAFFEK